ncbi:MAG: DUF2802 domain-containing protein [Gammaproteobacteria bacterium]|nr:DUF2802 domain-containing protein [Gammaproteobacteria bacterium]
MIRLVHAPDGRPLQGIEGQPAAAARQRPVGVEVGKRARLDYRLQFFEQVVLVERLDRPAAAAPSQSLSPGYQIAIRLARGGASREELMSGCGLTLAEAELVRRLHGPHAPELRQVS